LKIINKIAVVFGIVFVVFSVFAGLANYELNQIIYQVSAPVSFIEISIIEAMLPFLLFAVLSFLLAFIVSRAAKPETEKQPKTQTLLEETTS
jgi:hypothetical protein